MGVFISGFTINFTIRLSFYKRTNMNKLCRKEDTLTDTIAIPLQPVKNFDNDNLFPILDCVKSYATLGETYNTLRAVFGEYQENPIL
jgi:methylmalonyl-CoA mutase N-terminal domain/subunit